MNAPHVALRQLARAAGFQTGYVDVLGRQHRASPEVILAALNAPDIDIATIEQAPAALHTFQHQHLAQRVEPTIVIRPNRRNAFLAFLPSSSKPERFTVVLQPEDDTTHEWSVRAAELPRRGEERTDTETYSIARLGLPALSMGYYTLSLHFLAGIAATTHILCAPVHCWLPSEETRWWGIFLLQRDRQLDAVAADPAVVRRFCYAQWLTEQQVLQVARSAHAQRVGLYLDRPIGVHAQSCDTWRWRTTFARNMSVGAPPDAFYPEGQVWNFPPLHPLHTREHGYAYVRAIMRRHLAVGQLLRLDHVMGLHRLSWVPKGASGRDGIYVHIQRRSSLLYSPLSHNVPKQYSLAKILARYHGACVIRCAVIISSACPSYRLNNEVQASQRLRRSHSLRSTRTICCHLQHFGNHGCHVSAMQRSAGSSVEDGLHQMAVRTMERVTMR
jgi:hypothetical protein